jgi:hypothetical protein
MQVIKKILQKEEKIEYPEIPRYRFEIPPHKWIGSYTTQQLKEILGDWEDKLKEYREKYPEKKYFSGAIRGFRPEGDFILAKEIEAVDEFNRVKLPEYERWLLLEEARLELIRRREFAQQKEQEALNSLVESKNNLIEKTTIYGE